MTMKTKLLTDVTVGDICDGFSFDQSEGKGLYGWGGKLIIQPEYQRSYIYDIDGRDKGVVYSLLKEYPIGLLYFVKNDDDTYEILDGQQRVTSFARFITESNGFSIVGDDGTTKYFHSLEKEEKKRLLETKLTIYICEGSANEIKEWFKTINITGVPLTAQELRNAAYHGSFVNAARKIFSNSKNPRMKKWLAYVKGDPKRQEVLETALKWISDGDIEDYMAAHRADDNADELLDYFETVIDWVSSLFEYTGKEVKGIEWVRLYKEYHSQSYNKAELNQKVSELMSDPCVTSKKGIFEFLLSNGEKKELLSVRLFPEAVKKSVYEAQTQQAEARGVSNCPMCASMQTAVKTKIYKYEEMDADHVTAWSRGGSSDISNCQMLCKIHNRSKGNR